MAVCNHCGTLTSEDRRDPNSDVFLCRKCGKDLNTSTAVAETKVKNVAAKQSKIEKTQETAQPTRRRNIAQQQEFEEPEKVVRRNSSVREKIPPSEDLQQEEESFCPNCNEPIFPGDEVCLECGHWLKAKATQSSSKFSNRQKSTVSQIEQLSSTSKVNGSLDRIKDFFLGPQGKTAGLMVIVLCVGLFGGKVLFEGNESSVTPPVDLPIVSESVPTTSESAPATSESAPTTSESTPTVSESSPTTIPTPHTELQIIELETLVMAEMIECNNFVIKAMEHLMEAVKRTNDTQATYDVIDAVDDLLDAFHHSINAQEVLLVLYIDGTQYMKVDGYLVEFSTEIGAIIEKTLLASGKVDIKSMGNEVLEAAVFLETSSAYLSEFGILGS